MLWVGLTGGIGTGKSTVTRILRHLKYEVIDADELAREVVKSGTDGFNEVIRVFGPGVVGGDGELNRKEIGSQVFGDRSKLERLEKIVHPRVRELCLQKKAKLASEGVSLVFYDVPLLFEKKLEDSFDQIVVVACASQIQKDRLMKRDGFSEQEISERIASQLPLEHKVESADFTIFNNDTIQDLEKQVNEALKFLSAKTPKR